MKYKDWLDVWFANYIEPSSKTKTCERYSEIIEKHLKVKLGEYELEELSPIVIQKYITELMQSGNLTTGKGLAANSVNGIITVIQNSLKLAYTLGELKEYTTDKIRRPKTKEKEVSCFSLAEQKKIEQAALSNKKRKFIGIVICLYSGLRIGELLALTWSDIDFTKGTLAVNKTCHDGRDEKGNLCRITDLPKTTSSKRMIPLPKQLLPVLKEYKRKSISEYVVESEKGEPPTVRSYQRTFELLQKRLHIRTIRKERTGRFGSERLGCVFFGEGGFVCSQCVSYMAFSQKSQEAKLEFSGKSAYFVLATYMEVEGKPCVLESVKKFDGNLFIDFGEGNSVQDLGEYYEKTYKYVLTGAFNRRFYEEKLRLYPLDGGIAMIDVDDFKIYNDLFGHNVGDAVLCAVAEALKEHVRNNDFLIRYGGDEFLLVLRRREKEEFVAEMKKIVQKMRDVAVKGFETIKISVSVGAVWGKGERAEEIVGRADEFMYRAKKTKDLLVAEDDEGKLSASAEKQLVLIVDDSEINRVILKEILRGEYEIIEAASGEECVNALKKYGTKVSVVLLDIIMPGMNGFDVLEYMTYNQLLSEIPVVAISGDETGETVRRAYEAGVSDYINRPFDARVVYRRVKNTVKVYSEQKRLISSVTREMREKEEATKALISLFGELVEFRNDFGGNHVKNVGKITELLLERLVTKTQKYNLSERDIFLISTASALHDVGKFAVKEEIVNKPAKLTDAEFEEMKKHTIYGAQVISGAKNFRNRRLMEYAYEICRWHHERYDGKGYPDGLSGEEIPISAQVTGVGDAYDALVSERVYKKAVSHEQAIEKILRGECGAFNPVLLECLSEISEDLKKL